MEAAGASCRGAAEMAGRIGVDRARRETARSDRDSIVCGSGVYLRIIAMIEVQ